MNCGQYQELLSPHLDNELPAAQAADVSAHLLSCAFCGARFDELKRSSRLVRDLPLAPLPAGFLSRLEQRRRAGPVREERASPAWLGPGGLAFAAVAVVCGLVVVGPWRSRGLMRAPGYALPQTSAAAPPSLKLAAEPPPPAAPAPAQSPLPLPPSDKAEPRESVNMETVAMLQRAAAAQARDGGGPVGQDSAPRYTNEQLHEMMKEESSREGMEVATEEVEPKHEPFMGEHLGTPEAHAKSERSIRQLAAMRKAVEAASGKASDVPIEGSLAPVLGSSAGGGSAVEDKPLTDGFWSGDYAGGNEGTRTIEDAKSWAALWRTLSTAPRPAVDFTRSRVVAVFLGARPTGGYAVEFADVLPTPRRVVVRWREQVPEPGQSPSDGATSPYALKVIPRSDLPVRFEKVR